LFAEVSVRLPTRTKTIGHRMQDNTGLRGRKWRITSGACHRAALCADPLGSIRPTGRGLSRVGLHWEAIDEDISIAGPFAGHAGEWERKTVRKGTLADFLLASPLRGAAVDLNRQHDTPGDGPDSHP
jgi:hypothetical protein